MLIEGSSGSSGGGAVGEHQPGEPMRDSGHYNRPAAVAVVSEMTVSQGDMAARAQAWRGFGAGTTSRFMANRALSRGAKTQLSTALSPPPPLSQDYPSAWGRSSG